MQESQYKATAACARFDSELAAYLEGELRPFVASHQLECSSCSDLLADLLAIRQAAGDLPWEEPSPIVWEKVRIGIASLETSRAAACAEFSFELEAFMEGEPRPAIVAHAQDCPPCGALLADLQSIRQAASTLPLEEPSPVVWTRVRAGIEALGAMRTAACTQFATELEAYMEGEERPFLASHERDCPSCGSLLADLQLIRKSAAELPLEEPSPVVWAKVRASLESSGAFAPSACTQFDAELEAYMEGEARPFIITHAQDCAPCGALLADLQSIRQAGRDLPQEEPSRVVWANVRARLENEGAFRVPPSGWRQLLAGRLFPHFAPLGALAALVFLGALLTLPSRDLRHWGSPEETASTAAGVLVASAAPVTDDAGLAPVVSSLESSFRASEASMTPDLKATYEKSLVSLDGSIRECLDSLQQEPRNTLARDYLLTAYTRKAEVLSSALEFEGR